MKILCPHKLEPLERYDVEYDQKDDHPFDDVLPRGEVPIKLRKCCL